MTYDNDIPPAMQNVVAHQFHEAFRLHVKVTDNILSALCYDIAAACMSYHNKRLLTYLLVCFSGRPQTI